MELFSEIYGCYYGVVSQILEKAWEDGLLPEDMNRIAESQAFSESGFHMIPNLINGEWALLEKRGEKYYSKLKNKETGRPVSNLEKAWILTLLKDRRMRLFLDEEKIGEVGREIEAEGIVPLFDPDSFKYFDKALDGDPYEDPAYIKLFRKTIDAIKERKVLRVVYKGGKRSETVIKILPLRMLYSTKDDKFRIMGAQLRGKDSPRQVYLNMGKVAEIESLDAESALPGDLYFETFWEQNRNKKEAVFFIFNERNALERSMLQFASYEKQTVYDQEKDAYICKIKYDVMEETELLIRILSFGPVLEVIGPENFQLQVVKRVRSQIEVMAELDGIII